jgi:leader peptidase (prepilin peptidase)/N-methyltransferase
MDVLTGSTAPLAARLQVAFWMRRSRVGRRLAWQVPIVAALVVVSIIAAGPSLELLPLAYLAVVTPELIRIDVRSHRLPNRLVVPGAALGLVCAAAGWATTGISPVPQLIAGVAYAAFLLLLCITGGMGMGDVKLGAALGFASWLPFVGVTSPVVAFLVGGVASVILLARHGRGGRIAFGPFLLAGFWAAVVLVAWVRVGP